MNAGDRTPHGLPESRIEEIAAMTRNPNRAAVKKVLRIAAAEAFDAGSKATVSETGDILDKIAALMIFEDADVDICVPGNHGGRGADADKWLVTFTPSDHTRIREFFGTTLAEALRSATL